MKRAVKKRKGRPATGVDPVITLRLPKALIDQLEARANSAGYSRSGAIRRLIEGWLVERKSASHVAGEQIDKLSDQSASAGEKDRRKRRLLKGHEEFQGILDKAAKRRGR